MRRVPLEDDTDDQPINGKPKPRPRRIGSYSALQVIANLDPQTPEAQLMRRVRAELTEHVGGHPSVTERMLIERATMLSLRVAQIDAKILSDEVLTLHDNQHALAWINALRRTLVDLGLAARTPGTSVTASLSDWVTKQQNSRRNSRVLVP